MGAFRWWRGYLFHSLDPDSTLRESREFVPTHLRAIAVVLS